MKITLDFSRPRQIIPWGSIVIYHLILYGLLLENVDRFIQNTSEMTGYTQPLINQIYTVFIVIAMVSAAVLTVYQRNEAYLIMTLVVSTVIVLIPTYLFYYDYIVDNPLVRKAFINLLNTLSTYILYSIVGIAIFIHSSILTHGSWRKMDMPRERIKLVLEPILTTSFLIGLVYLTIEFGSRFYDSILSNLVITPVEIRGFVETVLTTNYGFLAVMTIFTLLIIKFVNDIVDPIVIYLGDMRGQALGILEREYRDLVDKESRVLSIKLYRVLLWAVPFIAVALLTAVFNMIYIHFLDPGTIFNSLIQVLNSYLTDLINFSHQAPATYGDIELFKIIDLEALEKFLAFLLSIIRFLFRLVFMV